MKVKYNFYIKGILTVKDKVYVKDILMIEDTMGFKVPMKFPKCGAGH